MVTHEEFFNLVLPVVTLCTSIAYREIVQPYYQGAKLITGIEPDHEAPLPADVEDGFVNRVADLVVPIVRDMCLVENWVKDATGWSCIVRVTDIKAQETASKMWFERGRHGS
jgi:hypothetical protein